MLMHWACPPLGLLTIIYLLCTALPPNGSFDIISANLYFHQAGPSLVTDCDTFLSNIFFANTELLDIIPVLINLKLK